MSGAFAVLRSIGKVLSYLGTLVVIAQFFWGVYYFLFKDMLYGTILFIIGGVIAVCVKAMNWAIESSQ